jgi:limonene-1,2-epoxide hydrolase
MPTSKPKGSSAGALTAVGTPAPSEPASVVVAFLDAWARSDLDGVLELVADDLEYTNVSLPTVHGKDRLELLARPVMRPDRVVFRAYLHHVAVDGDVVLTDRVDELKYRRFASRFWVYGRFVVRDGKIVVWRDSFDWLDVTIGNLRGLLGIVVPEFNRRWPGER